MTNKEFKTVKGISVYDLKDIEEGYIIVNNKNIYVNVSAENIDIVFRELCKLIKEPAFMIIEVSVLNNSDNKWKNDTFYSNRLTYKNLMNIFDKYGDILINDGITSFGYGNNYDEVFVGAYKTFLITSNSIMPFIKILKRFGFKENKELKTIYLMNPILSMKNTGRRTPLNKDGINIYNVLDELKKVGIHRVGIKEDKHQDSMSIDL